MKKILSSLLVLLLAVGFILPVLAVDYGAELNPEEKTYTQHFSDVPSDNWAFTYIEELVEKGAINGFPDGNFYPQQTVTREQFAKIMVCAAGVPVAPATTSSYSDVPLTYWASPFVEAAKPYMTAYRNGDGSLSFRPSQGALREDMAVAVVKLRGYDTRLADLSLLNIMFSDADSISEAAKPYVALAVENGIISGYPGSNGERGTFGAQRTISRAEATAILWRAFQYGNDQKVIPGDSTVETTVPPSAGSEPATPAITPPSTNQKKYEIDTVASNLYSFRSMVMDNQGIVYYINGNEISNTGNTDKLYLNSSFGTKLENPYLAYDPYHDIIYLLAGGSLMVFDISDFNTPELVMDGDTCPALVRAGKLGYISSVTPQIAVLPNGALLVPFDSNGTWMLNPKTQTAAQTTRMYDFSYSSQMRKLLGDSVMGLESRSTSATVASLGSNDGSQITLAVEAPYNNANSVISRNSLIYFYDSSCGLCTIAIDGSFNILIPKSEIEAKDYQGLDTTNIWCLDVNQNERAAFYDNSLKCIRLIQPS